MGWIQTREMVWSGALEAAAVLAAFVGFGLGWAHLEAKATGPGGTYPREMAEVSRSEGPIWLVDGFNVLHAGILGGRDRSEWWTRERREELLECAGRFEDPAAEIWVVFDGPRPLEDSGEGSRVRPVFAPSADEWLLDRIRSVEQEAPLCLVTADRRLGGRARGRGALVVSPGDFLARCAGRRL